MANGTSDPKESVTKRAAIVLGETKDAFLDGFRERIAKRAYELFEELGRVNGNDLSHWLRAENELCVRLPQVQESGVWYTVSAPLVGVPADHIRVSVENRGALISADKSSDHGTSDAEAQEVLATYYAVRWPESVSPETASAYLKNGTLTLVARKAAASESGTPSAFQEPAGEQKPLSKRAKR